MSTDSTKPQISTTPSSATDTIVTENNQSITDPRPKRTTKAVNQYGVKILSGGVTADAGFFEAVVQIIENFLSYHPVAVAICAIVVLHYVAAIGGVVATHGPFVLMTNATAKTHKQLTSTVGKGITAAFHGIFKTMSGQANFYALVGAYLWPYLCKPSARNGVALTILFLYAYLSGLGPACVLASSFCFFLITALRNPQHKAFVLLIMIFTCLISMDTLVKVTGTAD